MTMSFSRGMPSSYRVVLYHSAYGIHDGTAAPLITTPVFSSFKLTCNDRSLFVSCNVTTRQTKRALLSRFLQVGGQQLCGHVRQFCANFLSGVLHVGKNLHLFFYADIQNYTVTFLLNKGLSLHENVSSVEGHETLCWSLIKGLVYIRALGSIPVVALLDPYLRLALLLDAMFLLPLGLQTIPDSLAGIIRRCRRAFLIIPYAIFVAPTHLVCATWSFPQACIDELCEKVECSVAPIVGLIESSQLIFFSACMFGAISEEIMFRGLLDWPLWTSCFIGKWLEKRFVAEEDPFEQDQKDMEEPKAASFNRCWVLLKSFSFATMHIVNWLSPGLKHASTEKQKELFVHATTQTIMTFFLSSNLLSPVAEKHGLAGAIGAHMTWNALAFGVVALSTRWDAFWPDE